MKRRLSSMKTVAKWWGNFWYTSFITIPTRTHCWHVIPQSVRPRAPRFPRHQEVRFHGRGRWGGPLKERWKVSIGFVSVGGQQPRKTAGINSRKPMKTIHKKQLVNGDMNKNHSKSRKTAQMSWCDPQCIPAVWWRGQSNPGKAKGWQLI